MSQPNIEQSQRVVEIRATLLDGLATFGETALALGKSERTINRLVAAGQLPIVRIGKTPMVRLADARERLQAPEAAPAPRRPGRPPSTASAPRGARRQLVHA